MGQEISISNETNVCLHVALKHVGPLFYENYLLPGQKWVRKVPPSFYTVEAKMALKNNIYTDKQVIIPIVACTAAGVAVVGVAAGAAAIAIVGSSEAAAVAAGTSAAAAAAVEGSAAASAGAVVAASAGSSGASVAAGTAAVAARTAVIARTANVARSALTIAKKLPIAGKLLPFVTAGWHALTNRPEILTDELIERQNKLNKISLFKMGVLINSKRKRLVIRGGPLPENVDLPQDILNVDQSINLTDDFEALELVVITDEFDDDSAVDEMMLDELPDKSHLHKNE